MPEGLLQHLVGVLLADVHEYVGDGTYGVPEWEGLVVRLREPARYLAECLLGWMGPGGDLAFLEMYLLANQHPPVWGHFSHMTSSMPPDLVPPHLNICRQKVQSMINLSSGGQVKVHYGSAASLRQVLPDEIDHMKQYGFLSFFGTAVLPSVWLYPLENHRFLFMTWVVAPSPTYRTDLMGELASPWQAPATYPTRIYEPPEVMP